MQDDNKKLLTDSKDKTVPSRTAKNIMNEKITLTKTQKKQLVNEPHFVAGAIMLFVLSAAVIVFSITKGGSIFLNSYQNSYTAANQSAYNMFYETGYDFGESEHHVSNDVAINLGNIEERSTLEVFSVADSTVECLQETDNKFWILSEWFGLGQDVTDIWILYTGEGIYTVDLNAMDVIIDNYNLRVQLTVPKPEITNFRITQEDSKVIEAQTVKDLTEGSSILNGLRIDATEDIYNSLMANESFYEAAVKSAETTLKEIVCKANPDLPDLKVTVTFI